MGIQDQLHSEPAEEDSSGNLEVKNLGLLRDQLKAHQRQLSWIKNGLILRGESRAETETKISHLQRQIEDTTKEYRRRGWAVIQDQSHSEPAEDPLKQSSLLTENRRRL